MTDATMRDRILDWMLDSDPALRWQVERDLARAPDEVWQATRARVATEGFGARMLALQDDDGQWAGGAYFPAGSTDEGDPADEGGQPYTATTWSLNSLREWGVDAAVLAGTAEKLDANSRWEYENLPYWGGEVDVCINSFTLANGVWLGADVEKLADWFLEHQMDDGGWNCAWESGSTVSSFHSTINALRGLLAYETAMRARGSGDATGGASETEQLEQPERLEQLERLDRLRDARHAGEEYLLARHLTRRLSTGEPVAPWVDRLATPFRWFYSELNAADHLRAASLADGTPPDPRMAEAIDDIRSQRQGDGTWRQARRHPGRVWFETDAPAGEPSKWLTFHAMRVLDWWDAADVRR